jgi:hypothetical protein
MGDANARRRADLSWSYDEVGSLAELLRLTRPEVIEYFRDGRRVSFIIERRIAREILNGTLATSEGANYDVEDDRGGCWEVRSLTSGGFYFCPSYMVGSGRSFDEQGFLQKVNRIDGYWIADVTGFPCVPCYEVGAAEVLRWWRDRVLGATSKISFKKAKRLLES